MKHSKYLRLMLRHPKVLYNVIQLRFTVRKHISWIKFRPFDFLNQGAQARETVHANGMTTQISYLLQYECDGVMGTDSLSVYENSDVTVREAVGKLPSNRVLIGIIRIIYMSSPDRSCKKITYDVYLPPRETTVS